LLFTTEEGGVMVAMLVTEVWACAPCDRKRHSSSKTNDTSMARAVSITCRDKCPPKEAPEKFKPWFSDDGGLPDLKQN